MGQIKEYRLRTEASGPVPGRKVSSDDISFGAGIRELGNTVQGVVSAIDKRKEQAEVSDLHAKMSEAHAKFTTAWQDQLRTADPGDKTISEKFVQSYDDYMGAIDEEISTSGGRNYFKTASASLRAHFVETSYAGQSELAGVKAKQDYVSSLNNLSSSLLNDPSSLGLAMEMHHSGLDNMVKSGNLPSEAAAELKTKGQTELTKSAIRGWIELNPVEAKQQLASGRWDGDIGGELKQQLFGEADQTLRARDAEKERARREAERAKTEAQHVTQNEFLAKMVDGKLTEREILKSNLEGFGSGSKEQFLQLLKTHNSEKIKTDPTVFREMWDRVHLPDGDAKKLIDENDLNQYMGRGLTVDNIQTLRNEMQLKKTQAGAIESVLKDGVVGIAKGELTKTNPLTGFRDPVGDEQLQKYMSFFLMEYSEQRKKGKTALELLSPDSKDYLGKHIGKFKRDPRQVLQTIIEQNVPKSRGGGLAKPPGGEALTPPKPDVSPRKEGESAADYLKRIGK